MLLKIFFSHMQLISVATSFDLVWPDAIVSMFNVFDAVGGAGEKLFSLNCIPRVQEGFDDSRFLFTAMLFSVFPVLCAVSLFMAWTLIHALRVRGARVRRG